MGGSTGTPRSPLTNPCLSAPLQPPSSRAGPKEISLLDLDDCEWLPRAITVATGETEAWAPTLVGSGSCGSLGGC